jgi:hypothetical protein
VVVVGYLLYQRIDDGIRQQLVRETEEFRALAGGNDPATGQPFGADVERMFEVFLERNIPDTNAVFVTFLDGAVHQRSPIPARYPLEQDPSFIARTAAVTDVASGRIESPLGAVDFLALPVRVDGVTRGVLSVAVFRDLERAEQQDILLGAVVVGLILLIIGSLLAWRLADRLLAPVLQTAATARGHPGVRLPVSGWSEARQHSAPLRRRRSYPLSEGERRLLFDVEDFQAHAVVVVGVVGVAVVPLRAGAQERDAGRGKAG